MKSKGLRIKLSTYPGILFGVRSYRLPFGMIHSIYIPFLELSLTFVNFKRMEEWSDEKESEKELDKR